MVNEPLTNPVIQVNGTATMEPNVEAANLCEIKDSQVVTTSMRIAEIFSKEHKRVMQSIRELDCSNDFRQHNFVLTLKDKELRGCVARQDPYYLITRDGFVFLVMGFTGKTAAKFKEAYIRAFNVMEERLRRMQSSPQYTMADAPRLVHEHLERMEAEEQPIVESYGQQRVVSTVTLARLTGRKHENICASVRRMFKHTLRPARLFIRTGRTVRRGFGRGYDSEGVQYLITIEGFRVMCTHAEGLSEDVQRLVMSEFYKAKGKNRPGQPNPSTPKMPPTPPDEEPTATAAGPTMPKDAADMMRRMVQAMAALMGVDVNEVSNLICGGRK